MLGLPSEGEVILALRNMAAKTVLGLPSEGEVILALRNMAAKTVLGLPSEGEVILALRNIWRQRLCWGFHQRVKSFWP